MKLTNELLNRLEESLRVTLTSEQRLILLKWYGHELLHGWDKDDFTLGIREVIHYYTDNRPKRPADMDIPPQLRNERRAILKREAAAYLKANDMTPEERKDLLDWVNSGQSVRDNPWLMVDEHGDPMDYLSAMRMVQELRM